ncbi:MAG: LPS assembly lipoprotein LptE [Lysobacter sp.]|nr:LPS assembly lipoprotein LptE [Lysobacter sp.]
MKNFLFAAIFSLAVAGCGFQLRDALTLPADLGPVRVVSADPYSPLAESLSQALTRIGATPADEDATTGVATLEIISERWGETPISLDQAGRAQEFTLRYAVVFALHRGEGADLLPQQTIELSRDFIAPPTDSIGKTSERELLARELRREMASSILRRIDSVSRQTKT